MRHPRRTGFGLMVVSLAIVLVVAAMVVLTDGNVTMVRQSRRMLYQAHRRNLEASALAWARREAAAPKDGKAPLADTKLDVTDLAIPSAALGLKVLDSTDGKTHLWITTTCLRGRNSVTASRGYRLLDQR